MCASKKSQSPLAPVRQLFSCGIVGLMLGTVWVWQRVFSPLFGSQCRFYPSCSSYVALALKRHGLARGGVLAIRRLIRCNPWFGCGGVDHVPD